MESTKIIIAAELSHVLDTLKQVIQDDNRFVLLGTARTHTELYDLICMTHPDLIVLESSLSESPDGTLLQKIRHNPDIPKQPVCFCVPNLLYFIAKFHYHTRTTAYQYNTHLISIDELNLIITDLLYYIGIPANLIGFKLLRKCIYKLVTAPDKDSLSAKTLYYDVADYYNTSKENIERSIRNAIEHAYANGRLDKLNYIFDQALITQKERPVNIEVITFIAENLRFRYRIDI